MPLPRDFLIEMARKYTLSPEQEDAFVIRFSSNKTEFEIAKELYINLNAFRARMTNVYKKFGFNSKGPGKYGRLLNFLTTEFRKSKPSDSPSSNLSEDELNDLVQEVRSYCQEMIQDQCGTMKSLTSELMDVSDLYTNVNILEKIPSRLWREVDEIIQDCKTENFDRFGCGRITDRGIPGLEAVEEYSKLMVLGKPGSGKTTFLKHLAIQCNTGKFQAVRVPIFITLKQFAEAEGKPSLLEYITHRFSDCDVSPNQIVLVLKHGKALVLLDGLDEVRVEDSSRVIDQVRDFSEEKFRTNQFVMTCRIAANSCSFQKFRDVEIADFDNKQIHTFAQKWFKTKKPAIAEKFIAKLQNNARIREMATNPLLLTMLCLVFEESSKFPVNHSQLYEEGVDILMKKWDETQNIQREQIYKNLSVQRKKDLLSKIALTTFERGDYFFKQKELEQYISDYIRTLPDAQNNPEAMLQDSEDVLKSIEAQHGLLVERAHKIYSFSHLTFQEYFTARAFIDSIEPQALDRFVNHITERRWQQVFLLAVGMSPSAESADRLLLLIKKQVDSLVEDEQKLQDFLIWVKEKSDSVKVPYKSAAVRAFYFNRDRDRDHERDRDLLRDLDRDLPRDLSEVLLLGRILLVYRVLDRARALVLDEVLYLARADYHALGHAFDVFDHVLDKVLDLDLKKALQELKEQLPVLRWKDNGRDWTEQLRAVMINYRNIGHDWQFSQQQKKLLQRYYDANKLLVACLNSDCEVSREVRQKIEDTLLLPMGKVKE